MQFLQASASRIGRNPSVSTFTILTPLLSHAYAHAPQPMQSLQSTTSDSVFSERTIGGFSNGSSAQALLNAAMASTVRCCCSAVSVGNIGSERISPHTRSVTGKLPVP